MFSPHRWLQNVSLNNVQHFLFHSTSLQWSNTSVINLLLRCQLQTPQPEKVPFVEEMWKCFINNSAKDEQFISKLLPARGRWSKIWQHCFWLRVVKSNKMLRVSVLLQNNVNREGKFPVLFRNAIFGIRRGGWHLGFVPIVSRCDWASFMNVKEEIEAYRNDIVWYNNTAGSFRHLFTQVQYYRLKSLFHHLWKAWNHDSWLHSWLAQTLRLKTWAEDYTRTSRAGIGGMTLQVLFPLRRVCSEAAVCNTDPSDLWPSKAAQGSCSANPRSFAITARALSWRVHYLNLQRRKWGREAYGI